MEMEVTNNIGPVLNWHLEDVERRFGFQGTKYTDVGFWFALLCAVLAAGVFFGVALFYALLGKRRSVAPWKSNWKNTARPQSRRRG